MSAGKRLYRVWCFVAASALHSANPYSHARLSSRFAVCLSSVSALVVEFVKRE